MCRLVSREEYGEMIRSVCMVLDGRTSELEKDLKQRMQNAAENYAFEEAARLRDQLAAVKRLDESQKAVTGGGDMDVVGYAKDDTVFACKYFLCAAGKLIGRENFFLPDGGDSRQEV